MAVTPAELLELATQRHRKPWNWTLHFAAVWGFALTLLLHSYLMFAATMIVAGAGFFELKLPKEPNTRWFRFVHKGVEWEKDWTAAPWNIHKTWRFLLFLLVAAVSVWALWTRDPVVLALIVGFGYLIRVMRENIEGGIDP